MSQAARHSSYLLIEDQLDAIGQKYRVWRLLRGSLLFATGAVVCSYAASAGAHLLESGGWTYLMLGLWAAWMAMTFLAWIIRPLLIRPRPAQVARLIEQRIGGLHNALTNSVQLASAEDLRANPWLPAIFDEILAATRNKPLSAAVKVADLRPLALRCGLIILPLAAALLIPGVPASLRHGWSQLFSPTAFVPKVGTVKIVDIQPRNTSLVTGQALEVTVLAEDSKRGMPLGRIIFDNHRSAEAEFPPPTPNEIGLLRYAYRVEHVEQPMRYRVEIGSTQSEWFTVSVVRQVKLRSLTLDITPPPYTGLPAEHRTLRPDEIEKAGLSAAEGSRIKLGLEVDVATSGALLQIDGANPQPMTVDDQGRRFTGEFLLLDDASAGVLLTEGAGQIIDRLPDPPLAIRCVKDSAPVIQMRWPAHDMTAAPDANLVVQATARDDHGLTSVRVLWAAAADQPLKTSLENSPSGRAAEIDHQLDVPPDLRKHGQVIRVQVEATDNRAIGAGGSPLAGRLGGQTTVTPIYEIKFRDADVLATQLQEQTDKLRAILRQMLDTQQKLHTRAVAWKAGDKSAMAKVGGGQDDLRKLMASTAATFAFTADTTVVRNALLMLSQSPAQEAVELARAIVVEAVDKQQMRQCADLQTRQRRIISTLEALLAMLDPTPRPTTQPTTRAGGDLPADRKEQIKKLNEDLKEFIKQEQRILDQTAALAKKNVDNFDQADKKLLEELKMAQEKLDAFIQEKVSDFSKLAEQDMANASLLKELMEIYSEVTMAKDALKKQAVEIAVPLEESGLELAKELESNLEKWLMDEPDRIKWTMEEPVNKTDPPMAELPKELEDMVGELMEQEEDLLEEAEDASSSWADSMDKGAGWDAMDGPISNMSAKGVTGNQLPNDSEIGGRAGEGRSGKSSGEMVEDTASGKGGRRTPTRLDPTPFEKGQVNDQSKDPAGGATGGGKLSGQGGAGLEGPVGPQQKEQMQRLAEKQAQLRNTAERLNAQYQLGRYDGFKFLESIALMRRIESDLKANRYDNALRRRDVLLDRMDTSRTLVGANVHVQHDTTPQTSSKVRQQINDARNGQLPAAWSEALKEYYRKLAGE